ncbi:MAG: hypothetical protein QOE34_1400 [Verrucomicrobiota bacterium]|jgi:hypothetical protein
MKNILNRGFSQLVVGTLVTKVTFIIAQLTTNPNFPTTDPTLAEVQAALDAVTQALTIANPTAQEQALIAARANLEKMLDDLADNLEKTANDDPVKLGTTGYDLRKVTALTSDPPTVPQNVRLKLTGVSGQFQVLFGPSDRAKGYHVQTSTDPNSGTWTDFDTFSSSRGIVLSGFPRAKDIWVRVRAIGPNNTKSGWSDPATILVN